MAEASFGTGKEWAGFLKSQAKEEAQVRKREDYHEGRVRDELRREAEAEDWLIDDPLPGGRGADLVARKGNRVVIIEAKGERGTTTQKDGRGRVNAALGQVIMRMRAEDPNTVYRYCVAFPNTPTFTRCAIPRSPRNRLALSVFYVDCLADKTRVLLPNCEDTIPLASFDVLFPK